MNCPTELDPKVYFLQYDFAKSFSEDKEGTNYKTIAVLQNFY